MGKADPSQVEVVKPTLSELTPGLLDGFQRYQEVNQVWRVVDARKVLVACAYTEDWDKRRLERVVREQLAPCLEEGGAVWIARRDGRPVAFAALLSPFFGSHNQYLELRQLQVSMATEGLDWGRSFSTWFATRPGHAGPGNYIFQPIRPWRARNSAQGSAARTPRKRTPSWSSANLTTSRWNISFKLARRSNTRVALGECLSKTLQFLGSKPTCIVLAACAKIPAFAALPSTRFKFRDL